MKNNILLFLLLGTFASAQTNRFFYEYKFIPDSDHKEEVKKEMMLLDIDKTGSSYYSHDKFVADSTGRAELEKQLKVGGGSISINKREKPGQVSYKVTKQYPDFKTYLFRSIAMDHYKIREDQKPEWKIAPDKQKIGEYNAQKAVTNLGGREWIAWFSTDIPFQDGPYIFYGLPGLIIKLEDATGSHSMMLVGNKKVESMSSEKEMQVPENVKVLGLGSKEIEVSKDQFKKAWKSYVNDPTKSMREMMMKNGGDSGTKVAFKVRTADGKEISDPNQVFREMEKRVKENLKKDNNPIEPDLVN
ncbi:GLPGLI family protein [Chryseobacterium lactis]|uniref:GLPGLI family protein n=1 Tax=Chryseobacterium lactis TaxID=1241981 RepID=A0A3G6RH27_CHRLC|nr:GLPGLI family protein [Chryseobacterium lactis]AZA83966.1 GLPGLI family protein [Chryseobacterium lactis]AZB04352.1 GLPGLI family protein [Chryseobacterium lactis]PNW12523.1 GLPGLI family protein [Chryseobacterium lactis]